jgi:phosphatidylcholine synthase
MHNDQPTPPKEENTFLQKSAAWGVHLLTASGAVAGMMAMFATTGARWRMAFAWMAVTLAIDSLDGALARACQVKRRLPQFDGALLDNIVDYFTYVIVPAFFLCIARLAPPHYNILLAILILLSSGYQFCQSDAKTPDHCFKGFPSYWNLVVFYLFMMGTPSWFNALFIVVCVALVFVPIKYIYPSRTEALRPITLSLGIAWSILLLIALYRFPIGHRTLVFLSLGYIGYYMGVSVYFTVFGYPGKKQNGPVSP